MKIQTKSIYIADDGREFDDKGECQRYEINLAVQANMAEFCAATEYSPRMFQTIAAWEHYKADCLPEKKGAAAAEPPPPEPALEPAAG